jgi:hypothetical protein
MIKTQNKKERGNLFSFQRGLFRFGFIPGTKLGPTVQTPHASHNKENPGVL